MLSAITPVVVRPSDAVTMTIPSLTTYRANMPFALNFNTDFLSH
jgi:hypothetical protein